MYKLEFGIVHEGCVDNELSRAVPDVRLVHPGGFIVSADLAEEVLALNNPTDAHVESVLEFLRESNGLAEVELPERTSDTAARSVIFSTGFDGDSTQRRRVCSVHAPRIASMSVVSTNEKRIPRGSNAVVKRR